jgi:hypothetical protein
MLHMKQRYIYTIIFGIPGMVLSFIAAEIVAGLVQGLLFLYMYGDGTWPEWTGIAISAIGIGAFVFCVAMIGMMGMSYGKKMESKNVPVQIKYILISLILCALLGGFIFTSNRGYVFKKPSYRRCQEMCVQHGYGAQSTSLEFLDSGAYMCSCMNKQTKKFDDVGTVDQ